MKSIVALLFAGTLALSSAATLPDASGDDNTTFEVKTEKDHPPPSLPADGSAQIVFIEEFDHGPGFCVDCEVTTRVGVDGKWVGANHGNSYFAFSVAPGVHHLCAGWQSKLDRMRQKVGVASLNAEAGKVYYFAIKVREIQVPAGMEQHLSLVALDDDEGKYRVKISALAAAKTKK
jgi:hypothetical protein